MPAVRETPGVVFVAAREILAEALAAFRPEDRTRAVEVVNELSPDAWPDPVTRDLAHCVRSLSMDCNSIGVLEVFGEAQRLKLPLAASEISAIADRASGPFIGLLDRRRSVLKEEAARRRLQNKAHILSELVNDTTVDVGEIAQAARDFEVAAELQEPETVSAFVDMARWRELAAAAVPWLFTGTIPDRAVTIIGSQGGLGKSTLAAGLAVSAILNRSLFPSFEPTRAVPVMMLAGEDSAEIVCRRLAAFGAVYGIDPGELDDAVKERLLLRALNPAPFLTMEHGIVRESDAFEGLVRTARARGVGLVIVDTLRKHLGPLDENSNSHVGAFLETCARLAAAASCAVIVLHHSNKTGAAEPKARATDIRGGSAVTDEARSAWVLKRTEEGCEASHVKSNYAPCHPPVGFRFEAGALVEGEAPRHDPVALVPAIARWLADNPGLVTPGLIKQRRGPARTLFAAIAMRYAWATADHVAAAAETGLSDGALCTRPQRQRNGRVVEFLEAVN